MISTRPISKNRKLTPYFGIKENRLSQFKDWENDSGHWNEYWENKTASKLIASASGGYLGELEILAKYLPKADLILEAGCGLGQVVLALDHRGFTVEGVDFAEETIDYAKKLLPDLHLRTGDITKLDVENNHYGGYISLGVLEHNPKGPLEGLIEAHRVLKPEGIACISVPYLNHYRSRIKKNLQTITDTYLEESNFYQYYFSEKEFSDYLNDAGFEIITTLPLDVYNGLKYDNKLVSYFVDHNFWHWRIHRLFRNWCQRTSLRTRRKYSHMIMFICRNRI